MGKGRMLVAFLAALLLGVVAGWLFRAWTHPPPSLQQRAHDTATEIQHRAEKAAR